jgi:wobble nucleotide-excising tRNase
MTGYDEAVPTIQNITAGLKSQVDYLQQYIDNIAKMRALGFSDDVLAMVSDGSAQSADYAAELAKAGASEVAEINKQVAEVKAKTSELATSLTENNLAVDETMQTLVKNYTDALEELNQYDGAKANAAQTVQGIVDGLGENAAAVQSQVNSILSMLAELSNASYGYNVPGVNFNSTVGGGSTTQVHTTINLDGTRLADAVSTHQANDLKNLQRSGWAGGDRQ